MDCIKCKREMAEITSEGDKYYTCSQCGDVKIATVKDKRQ